MNPKKVFLKLKTNDMSRSVLVNLALKPISLALSLLYTPFLLRYLGDEQYGIWVTILSVINWITYFDIGIGNGLRNRITVEINNKDFKEVRKSISTAYVAISLIVILICVVFFFAGTFINWNSIFNTSRNIKPILVISFTFICVNFILSLQKNGYYALQKSEMVSLSGVLVQLLNTLGVIILIILEVNTKQLIFVSILFGISSLIINIVFSFGLGRNNRCFIPSLRDFSRGKLKEICSLGVKFFLIQISALVLFTSDSLIISNLFSPESVTPYNTVHKAFGAIMSITTAILVPYWSRFTVAKEQRDFLWMKKTLRNMITLWGICSVIMIIIIPFYQIISDVWLGQHIKYDNGLVIMMVIYYISYIYSSIYSTALNGLGDINVQLICAVASAIVNIPLSVFFAVNCGMATTGVCLGTVISLVFGDIVFTIQMNQIIKRGRGV